MAKRPLRKTNQTTLIVVEGETELAFVSWLKEVYYQRGMPLSVSIKNAHGHGPDGVIDKIRGVLKTAGFDRVYAVLDADIPLTAAQKSYLEFLNVECLISDPAIEATLLAILRQQVPLITDACKRRLMQVAPGDATDVRFYRRFLPRHVLDAVRQDVAILERLIAAVSQHG